MAGNMGPDVEDQLVLVAVSSSDVCVVAPACVLVRNEVDVSVRKIVVVMSVSVELDAFASGRTCQPRVVIVQVMAPTFCATDHIGQKKRAQHHRVS